MKLFSSNANWYKILLRFNIQSLPRRLISLEGWLIQIKFLERKNAM